MWRAPAIIGLLMLVAGCGASQTAAPVPTAAPAVNPWIECTPPRPQVCTMEYNPVCARLESGRLATYSSPCNACADDAVTAWRPGACPDQ